MRDLFPQLTGRGVRIAIIDSGVHPDHPHIDAAGLRDGVAITSDGAVSEGAEATVDRLGHGTAVTAAIQEKAPDALCLPVRVFHDSLRTSAAALISAIDWSIAQKVDIINLSLGTVNIAHRPAFEAAADRALAAGIAIVAAREANDVPCLPGSLPQALSVGLDWDCARDGYRVDDREGDIVFTASGHPRPIPGVPQRRNLYGISFAVANMTGFAALACELTGSSVSGRDRAHAVRTLLEQGAFVPAI